MRKAILFAIAVALFTTAVTYASGSNRAARPVMVSQDPLTVTESLKCVVTHIREDGTVMVRDIGTEKEQALGFTKKTSFRAQDKQAFDGRKKLTAEDLQVGQVLRVTHRPYTGEVLSIKVLKAT